MKYTAIRFLLLLSVLSLDVHAQLDLDVLKEALPTGSLKKEYAEAQNNKNEMEAVFSGLFLAYKTFFSSQDLTVCTFTPSCSEYGILAVKKYGPIRGGVMTMDRLMRCNGLSPNKYTLDKKNLLLMDMPGLIEHVNVLEHEH